MSTSVLIEQIFHVFEKLKMSSLVTCNGNSLNIFLNCRLNNFQHRPVMSKMNNFRSLRLKDPAHDINCSIMSVE